MAGIWSPLAARVKPTIRWPPHTANRRALNSSFQSNSKAPPTSILRGALLRSRKSGASEWLRGGLDLLRTGEQEELGEEVGDLPPGSGGCLMLAA